MEGEGDELHVQKHSFKLLKEEKNMTIFCCWPLHTPAPAGLLALTGRFSAPSLLMRKTEDKCHISQQRENAFRELQAARS